MQKKLISVIGSTGIGKTRLAIELAKYYTTEIVSCDSRQFFKEMKIGTAMPNSLELAEVPHHFIGNLSVENYYSIGQYEVDALQLLNVLFEKYDTVVLVGGSGMYEKAVTEGLNDLPEVNTQNQEKLLEIWENQGLEQLQKLLEIADPNYFAIVDKDNPRRLLRALDIIWQTGTTYTQTISEKKPIRNFETLRIGLEAPREILYQRINDRVEVMLKNNLIDEVKSLLPFREKTALQTVGYKEFFHFLDETCTYDFAVEEMKKNSRRYAKRQITWNKKLENVQWLSYDYTEQQLLTLLDSINI